MTPDQLRRARKRLGLTQHGLAEALRMGRWGFQSVAKWEKGEVPIPGPAQVAIEHMIAAANEWRRSARLRRLRMTDLERLRRELKAVEREIEGYSRHIRELEAKSKEANRRYIQIDQAIIRAETKAELKPA